MSETIPGTMLCLMVSVNGLDQRGFLLTSPAAVAKPDKHLAANSPLKVVVLAVAMRTTKSINVARSSDARLPYLTPIGTQKRLPMPRRRKLYCLTCKYS